MLGWNAASLALRHRGAFLHHTDGEPWPDWSAETLTRTVDRWLGPYLATAASRDDLERIDLVTVLRSQLPWPAGARLDELAPRR